MASITPRFNARPTIAVAAPVALVGIVLTAIGVVLDPHRAMASYLVAWLWLTTIAIGALAFLLIGYASNATWVAVVRRLAETVASAIVPCAILFVPLAIGATYVWPWVDPGPELAAKIAHRARWLSLAPFVARSAVYLAILVATTVVLARRSRARDEITPLATDPAADPPPLGFERGFASAMLLACGLAASFAGFDWVMSLEPTWSSTAFGLYVITGALTGGMAVVIVLAARGLARGWVPLTRNHFHAMGRLLLAFTMLWGYIAYFQAFLIRIANRPDEVPFYLHRLAGAWRGITYGLIAAHLAIPLTLLVPRGTKTRPRVLASIAALLALAHLVDLWWIVIPAEGGGPVPAWTDLTALLAVGGAAAVVVAWRAHGVPHVATGDPYLAASLTYASPT